MGRIDPVLQRAPRIYFLIRSLERGGAERQLIELARGLAKAGYEVTVATLYDGGAMRAELVGTPGITVSSYGKSGRWDPRFLWRFAAALFSSKPDLIHGYMSPANELAVTAAWIVGARSVFGLRASNVDLSQYGRFSRVLFRVSAYLSHCADAIVVNSEAGREHHVAHGYDPSHMTVIPNGIDCDRFQSDPDARAKLRAEWGVRPEERLIGIVGRVDPMKDHRTFVKAAALMRHREGVRFVCVGGGSDSLKGSLIALARELQLEAKLFWVGARNDMSSVYSAIDLLASSSAFGEGFPNVVAEAMAVGRPCVVTAVGDAAQVVGDTGLIVPPKDPQALARAMSELAFLPEQALAKRGLAARQRIMTHFSTRRLVDTSAALFRSVLGVRAQGKRFGIERRGGGAPARRT